MNFNLIPQRVHEIRSSNFEIFKIVKNILFLYDETKNVWFS